MQKENLHLGGGPLETNLIRFSLFLILPEDRGRSFFQNTVFFFLEGDEMMDSASFEVRSGVVEVSILLGYDNSITG